MSSATVSPINCPSGSCNTVPTVLDNSKMLEFLLSLPLIFKLPVIVPSCKKGTRPFIQLENVLFPEPDGPTISTFSPSYIVKFMLFNHAEVEICVRLSEKRKRPKEIVSRECVWETHL